MMDKTFFRVSEILPCPRQVLLVPAMLSRSIVAVSCAQDYGRRHPALGGEGELRRAGGRELIWRQISTFSPGGLPSRKRGR